MEEDTIPPSPNWYLSSILSCSDDGAVAYGSKNQVVVYRRATRQISIVPGAHLEKVTAVSFGHGATQDLLATVGSDQWVRVWDTKTLQPHLGHTEHGENARIASVDWSRANHQLVVSVDEGGMLAVLDLASRTTQTFQFPRLRASTLACCPHDADLVAVGDTTGLVYVVTTRGGRVLHRMRGHDTAVVSLSWCPVPDNVLSGDGPRDLLLASGAKASSVFVWRAGADGRQQAMLELPTAPVAGKKTPNKQHKTMLSAPPGTTNAGWWVATCWPRPHVLLTSSLWGETLAWDMTVTAEHRIDKPGWKKSAPNCHLFNTLHSRGLFSIACAAPEPSAASRRAPPVNWRKTNVAAQQPEYRPKFRRKVRTQGIEEDDAAFNKAKDIETANDKRDGERNNLDSSEVSESKVEVCGEVLESKVEVCGDVSESKAEVGSEVSESRVEVRGEVSESRTEDDSKTSERNGHGSNETSEGKTGEGSETSKSVSVPKETTPNETGRTVEAEPTPGINGTAKLVRYDVGATKRKAMDGGDDALIWTCGQDRLVCIIPLGGSEPPVCLPTVGGNVYCMAESPVDSHRLAFGAGDGMIRVWTISPGERYKMLNLWNKISGKVTALSWHPTKELWLAYGTSDGRVGIYDTAAHSKGPAYLWNQHKTSVYTLGWGPPTYKEESEPSQTPAPGPTPHRLYSCGDGAVLQYTVGANNRVVKLTDIADWAKQADITDFAWKQDLSLVAFGCEDGSVVLCRPPHLAVMCRLQAHKKMVQSLAWHPLTTALHPDGCPERHWLAVSSKSVDIRVFDLAPLFRGVNVTEAEACVASLTGHRDRVTRVAWSPYISGRLLSCAYDSTAQVWDVHASKQLAVYKLHTSWIYCCMWSPFDTNLAITGGGDFTLRIWSVDDNPPSPLQGKGRVSAKRAFPVATRLVSAVRPPEKTAAARAEDSTKVMPAASKLGVRKISYFPVSSQLRNRGKDFCVQSCYSLLQAMDAIKQECGVESALEGLQLEPPSLTTEPSASPVAAAPAVGPAGDPGVQTTQKNLIGGGDLTHLGFFTDRDALERLVKQEEEMLIANKNRQLAEQLRLWRTNNYAEMLEAAKAEKRLTSWHLAIAPMVSPRVWRDTCVAYATQLTEKDRVTDAADMLIAVRRPREAIDLLVSVNLYREAMIVARCQTFDRGEAARDVLKRWGAYAEEVGNYELALDCYVGVGEYLQAARLQGCRQDAASLQLAAHLASRGSAPGLEFTLAQQCVHTALAAEDWARAGEVVAAHQGLKGWVWLTEFYREILDSTKISIAVFNERVWAWLEGAATGPHPHSTAALERVGVACAGVDLSGAELMLRTLQMTEPTTPAQLLILVSGYLTVGATKQRWEDKCLVWTAALAACHQYQLHHGGQLLLRVFLFLFPNGPQHLSTSLQAYCYAGVLSWLLVNMWFHRKTETDVISGRLSSILKVLAACSAAVFSAEAIFHFQTIRRIEESERSIAIAGSKQGSARTPAAVKPVDTPVCEEEGTEVTPAELPSETPSSTAEGTEATPVEHPSTAEGTEATPVEHSFTAEGTEATLVEHPSTAEGVEATPVEDLPAAEVGGVDAILVDDPALRFVNSLRALKSRFVSERRAAPNPFVVYMETKNMFTCCSFAEGRDFLAQVEEIWAKAEAEAAEQLREIEAQQQ